MKRFLVTGANGVIGKEIVRGLLQAGNEVVLAVQHAGDGAQVVEEFAKEGVPKARMKVMQIDLSSQHSIKRFADEFKANYKELHGLINNAASNSSGDKRLTVDGIELIWGINVMGYFLLTNLLLDILKASAPSRIVFVASNYAGDLDIDDVMYERRPFSTDSAYRQSKQALRMLVVEFNERLKGTGVSINGCHPGVTASPVLSSLGFAQGWETPAQSAATPLHLALSPKVDGISGGYFSDMKQKNCQFADKQACAALWDVCTGLVKL